MDSSVGFNNLLWFMGIVENNNDPSRNGRIQVRCFGIHPTAESGQVLTDDLPWAPMLNAGHGGTVIPTNGDWVFGAFVDGRDAQHPFIFGSIPGINAQLPTDSGSSDPYTRASKEAFDNYGMPPLPRVQSGEDLETTQLTLQNASLLEFAPPNKADGTTDGLPVKEPAVPYATQPHKNAVWKSRNSNSYLQITEGDENIILSHESGSHIMIDKGGNIKIKSFGDSYMISEGNTFEGAKGTKSLSVDGPYSLKCKNASIEVEGDMSHVVNGDYSLNIGGKFAISVGQGFEVASQRISLQSVSEHINLLSAQKVKISAGDNVGIDSGANVYLKAGGELHTSAATSLIGASGPVHINAGGATNIDGSQINLNSGASTAATPSPESASGSTIAQPVQQSISANISKVRTTPGSIGAGSTDDQEE